MTGWVSLKGIYRSGIDVDVILENCTITIALLLYIFKVAVDTTVPRSPFFAFCTPKYRNEMRSNVCVNEMALFGPLAALFKGKIFLDSHGGKGGLPTRRDSGPTRYGGAPH